MPEFPSGSVLIAVARHAIASELEIDYPTPVVPDVDVEAATFVTLTIAGRLRGCIGTLTAYRCVVDDVADHAVAAAFHDPRFPALSAGEFRDIDIEVSVLTPAEPIEFSSRDGLEAALRPGIDGLIISHGSRRATFLPQVWEQIADPHRFVDALLRKAGIPQWTDEIDARRYRVESFTD